MKSTTIRTIVCGGAIVALAAALAVAAASPRRAPRTAEPPPSPLGLAPVPWPEDNPYAAEKVELGRLLYFDPRLSSDATISCASCHAPAQGFTDGSPVSTGINGQKGGRSAPTVINRAFSTSQFWDGRAASLEEQAQGPIANPIEMTNDKDPATAHKMCVQRLRAVPGYVNRFRQVFGTPEFTIDHVAKAIASFERTILSGDSPYDRYQAGQARALTDAQIRGMDVFFNKAACDACHLGFNFTDGSYVNIGIGMDKPNPDLGRYGVSKKEEDRGAFKTPTLREIEHTAPYMHDGRFQTLAEVVEHYNKGGIKNPYLDQRMKPLNLTDGDKRDLIAFLKGLSGQGWRGIRAPAEFPK